jgi:hypothetical protein
MAKEITYRNTMNNENLIPTWQKKLYICYRNTMNTPIITKQKNNIPNIIK